MTQLKRTVLAQRVGLVILVLATVWNMGSINSIKDDLRSLDFAVDLLQARPAPQIGKVLQLERLEIVTPEGEGGISLSASKGYGEIGLFNQDGGRAFHVGCQEKGDGMLFLANFQKEPTLLLGADDSGGGFITAFGREKAEASMGFNGSGGPQLSLGRDKRQLISLGTDRYDHAILLMKNWMGEILVQAGAATGGHGHVAVNDQSGRNAGVLLPISVR